VKKKILWLDSDPEFLGKGKKELEKSGNLEVHAALTVREAMEKLRSTSYLIIIAEFQLPEMDGLAFQKIIRTRHRRLPFILFTARDDEEIMKWIDASPFDFYLRKHGELPDQFRSLLNMVVFVYVKTIKARQMSDQVILSQDKIWNLPFPAFAVNHEGIVCFWNRALEKLTGKEAQSIVGKGNFEYALPFTRKREPFLIDAVKQDSPDIRKRYPGIIRNGQTCIFERMVLDINRENEIFLKFIAAPYYPDDGSADGIQVFIQNITEYKLGARELKMQFRALQRSLEETIEEKDLYRTLFEKHNAASVVINNNEIILLANREFSLLTGYEQQEIEGRMSWAHFMPDTGKPAGVWCQGYAGIPDLAGINAQSAFRLRDRTGNLRDVTVRMTRIPETQNSLVTIIDTSGINNDGLEV
jgi:PAS domain S-box-containing protein